MSIATVRMEFASESTQGIVMIHPLQMYPKKELTLKYNGNHQGDVKRDI